MAYDINPRLKLFSKGACFKLKHQIIMHEHPGVTSSDKALAALGEVTNIQKGSALIYIEDMQFLSPSKELSQPMSAWVRAKVMIPNGKMGWITLFCENKAIWDFKTYTGKKNHVLSEIKKSFEIISLSLNSDSKNLIDDSFVK